MQGVPDSANENIYKILETIGNAINCEISPNEISAAHRVQHVYDNNKAPRNIIVKCVSGRNRRFKRSTTNAGVHVK